jgi:hypothetical protein
MKTDLIEKFDNSNLSRRFDRNERFLEVIILISLLASFIIIGFIQASRLTHIGSFQDQVMFIDPAANLYFGNGFTSSTWFAQTKDKFWAGYPPLYSLLLYLWMKVVGFGVHTAHSLNCILIATCIVVLWKSVIRFRLITSAKVRLIFISLMLLEFAYINNFQQGRPDVLMACLISTGLLIYSIQRKWLRHILLLFVFILLPLSGLAVVAYVGILGCLLLIYFRTSLLKGAMFMSIGLLAGFLCLYILYDINGVWPDFIDSILKNPTISSFDARGKIAGILGNRILQILVILCFLLSIFAAVKKRFNQHKFKSKLTQFSPLSFGLATIFLIPLGMRLVSAFPFYYSWMVIVPLAICVFCYLDKLCKPYLDRYLKSSVLVSVLILTIIVSPYSGFIDLILNWESSDYSRIESFVQQALKTVDKDREWILSDPVSYFAVKKEDRVVLYRYYLDIASPEEKEKVSFLIVRPKEFPVFRDKLGGEWDKQDKSLIISYRKEVAELGIYRRK